MVQRYAHLSVDHLTEYAERLSQLRVVSTNPALSGMDKTKSGLQLLSCIRSRASVLLFETWPSVTALFEEWKFWTKKGIRD